MSSSSSTTSASFFPAAAGAAPPAEKVKVHVLLLFHNLSFLLSCRCWGCTSCRKGQSPCPPPLPQPQLPSFLPLLGLHLLPKRSKSMSSSSSTTSASFFPAAAGAAPPAA